MKLKRTELSSLLTSITGKLAGNIRHPTSAAHILNQVKRCSCTLPEVYIGILIMYGLGIEGILSGLFIYFNEAKRYLVLW